PAAGADGAGRAVCRFSGNYRGAARRSRCLLRRNPAGHCRPRCPQCAAPGLCGNALEQAVLQLQRAALAGGRPQPAGPAARAPQGPQRRVEELRCQRHHLDARHLGVPLVCGLGFGVSRHSAGAGRPLVCQKPAAAAVPRLVHAPQRPAARLRVALRGCEPAGARLGRVSGV
nr:hypothetical protein [Tanacetum cinerariifolium]